MDQLLAFIKTNKRPLIQIGGAIAGAVVGVVITALVMTSSDEEFLDLDDELEIDQ